MFSCYWWLFLRHAFSQTILLIVDNLLLTWETDRKVTSMRGRGNIKKEEVRENLAKTAHAAFQLHPRYTCFFYSTLRLGLETFREITSQTIASFLMPFFINCSCCYIQTSFTLRDSFVFDSYYSRYILFIRYHFSSLYLLLLFRLFKIEQS